MFHSLPLHHKTSQLTKDRVTRPAAISVREFGLKVGGRDVLCDVTLDIRKGEVLGLIGRTGAGKSVLMRAMCRLL
ncbi:MAG: ATP-binding cassette domain-containing protein, partial [Tritonibacter mobilis]|nr:ATP-binding cassette domain-containing protein [Tritonibacter mobilis]